MGSTPTIMKVYRCTSSLAQQFQTDAAAGTISTTTTETCLAARDAYTPPPKGIAGVQIWTKPLGNNRSVKTLSLVPLYRQNILGDPALFMLTRLR